MYKTFLSRTNDNIFRLRGCGGVMGGSTVGGGVTRRRAQYRNFQSERFQKGKRGRVIISHFRSVNVILKTEIKGILV